ncbi:MAG: ABC transporter permease [Deltaproteobacteria bacterium]|nr:ABC transporter permease [Deltaproteobacteria bacterium]MBW2048795.1 ABC transporter permease [Deltaproteobacteria bacterium]MBW2110731.1 ABC transporter permease [Deltaproteobacteria bacterium]MBW2352209.1 ABC transporter permease [Deltaproteobacteria bacterium]
MKKRTVQTDNSEFQTPRSAFRILPWIIPLGFILLWFMVSETGMIPTYLMPHPAEIGKTGYNYILGNPGEAPYAGRFLDDAVASLMRVAMGFALAVILGLPLGIISGRISLVQRLMGTTINGLRAVPGISWLPLAMIWFGIGIKTTVFLVALAAFFPIYLNAAAGARQINPLLLQAGAMMGVKRLRGTFAILLPGAMPHIMTGLRLGLGISWAYLVLGELTGVPNGLGALIMDARMLGRIDIIVLGIIIIAVIGRVGDQLLKTSLRVCFKSARRMT